MHPLSKFLDPPLCRAFSMALKTEKLKAQLFPGQVGAGVTNDLCIIARETGKGVFDNYLQKFLHKIYCKPI